MSFTRAQYEEVFTFALKVLTYHESRHPEIENEAIKVMDLCEDVIGQQSNRPEWTRRA